MHPVLFDLFGYPVRMYGLAMASAFLINIILIYRRAPIEHLDREVCLNTTLWIVIGTLVGGRVLFAITQWEEFVTSPLKLISFWQGGLVFYGGFIGSYMAALAYLMWVNLSAKQQRQFLTMLIGMTFLLGYIFSLVRVLRGKGIEEGFGHWVLFWNYGLHHTVGFIVAFFATYTFWAIKMRKAERNHRIMPILDMFSPYVGFGLAIHRTFGCFMNGCCYGRPTDVPWGVHFPLENYGTKFFGIAAQLHPTQIYEALNGLVIFFVLFWYRNRKKAEGEVTALLLMLYAINRYLIEFVRGDNLRGDLGTPMSTATFVFMFAGVALLMYGYLALIRSQGIKRGIVESDSPFKVTMLFVGVLVFLFVEMVLGEMLRINPTLATVGPISTSQFIGYLTFLSGFFIFVTSRYLGRRATPFAY